MASNAEIQAKILGGEQIWAPNRVIGTEIQKGYFLSLKASYYLFVHSITPCKMPL